MTKKNNNELKEYLNQLLDNNVLGLAGDKHLHEYSPSAK